MLKSLSNPPPAVAMTFTCILHLFAGIDPEIPVDKNGKLNADNNWKLALKLMANPKAFLDSIA